jgi:hypothetical protein
MTRSIYTSYRDVPKLECLAMTWSFRNAFTILASDNVKFGVVKCSQLSLPVSLYSRKRQDTYDLLVTAGVIPMAR